MGHQIKRKTKEKLMLLNKLSRAQFDRLFEQNMVKDHKEAISTFEKEAKSKGRFAPLTRFRNEGGARSNPKAKMAERLQLLKLARREAAE